MVEGYNENKKLEIEVARFAAYRIHQSLVEKPLPIEKFWPLRTDAPEREDVVMTPEMLEKIKQIHGLK